MNWAMVAEAGFTGLVAFGAAYSVNGHDWFNALITALAATGGKAIPSQVRK